MANGTVYTAIIEVDTQARGNRTSGWPNMGDGRRYSSLLLGEPIGKRKEEAKQLQAERRRELLNRRLDFLEVQCGYIYDGVQKDNKGRTPDLLIVTAPEFLMARLEAAMLAKPSADQFCHSESDKEYVRTRIAQMTRNLPGLLLVPGSIFWFKSTQRPEVAKDSKTIDPQRYARRVQKAGTSRDLSQRYIQGGRFLPPKPQVRSNDLEMLLYDQEKVEEDVRFQLSYTGADQNAEAIKWTKNTVFFGYGGMILATYDKKFPDGSEMTSKSVVFVPGQRSGVIEVPSVNGPKFTVGIELCRDNMSGALVTAGVGALDVHLVLSAYIDGVAKEATAARDGGILANADSRHGGSVFTVNRTQKKIELIALTEKPNLGLYSSFGPTKVFKAVI